MREAVAGYRECLSNESSFVAWTLEDVVAAIEAAGAGAWIDAFEDRYLRFERLGRGEATDDGD